METAIDVLKTLNPLTLVGKVWTWVQRPRLRLYFDSDQTYQTARVVDENGALGYFCHLIVANEGRVNAKNCRGRLIQVSIRDQQGNLRRDKDFANPAVLKWAHEMDYEPRDIEPQIHKRLDLCYAVESKPSDLIFFTPQLPNGNRTVYPPGHYEVKVRIDADNASQVTCDFIIDFPGGWNQIKLAEATK